MKYLLKKFHRKEIAKNSQKKISLSNYFFNIKIVPKLVVLYETRKVVENAEIDFYTELHGDTISNLARISHLSGTSCYASHSRGVFFMTSQDL